MTCCGSTQTSGTRRESTRPVYRGRRLVEQIAQTNPILLAQPAANLADGLEAVRLFIVDGPSKAPMPSLARIPRPRR